jgi:hypothetical protein
MFFMVAQATTENEKISDCPIIGQGYRGPFIVCWHDCDGDGIADRQCFYVFKDNEVKTIDCFYGEDIEQ